MRLTWNIPIFTSYISIQISKLCLFYSNIWSCFVYSKTLNWLQQNHSVTSDRSRSPMSCFEYMFNYSIYCILQCGGSSLRFVWFWWILLFADLATFTTFRWGQSDESHHIFCCSCLLACHFTCFRSLKTMLFCCRLTMVYRLIAAAAECLYCAVALECICQTLSGLPPQCRETVLMLKHRLQVLGFSFWVIWTNLFHSVTRKAFKMVLDNNNGLNLCSTCIQCALQFASYSTIHIFVSLKVSFYEVKCISLCTAASCILSWSFYMYVPLSLTAVPSSFFPTSLFDKLKASLQCIVNGDRKDGRVTKILTQIQPHNVPTTMYEP